MSETANKRKTPVKKTGTGTGKQTVATSDAELKAKAEQEAKLKAEAEAKAKAAAQTKANVLGAFIASAKSEQGFWRAGVKFARNKKTLLVVCEFDGEPIEANVDDIKHDEVIYIGKDKAARIHREPNLVIEDVEL